MTGSKVSRGRGVNLDPSITRRVLSRVFSMSLQGKCDTRSLSESLGLGGATTDSLVKSLVSRGLIERASTGSLRLTAKGRRGITVVLAGGVFDIIHPGHIYTLKKAKSLGDVLVVSVARDGIVKKLRGKPPMNGESLRAELVGSIRYVDASVLGSTQDPIGTIFDVKPDIVAIGYDQAHDESEMLKKAEARGVHLSVVRLDSANPWVKSTEIKKDERATRSF